MAEFLDNLILQAIPPDRFKLSARFRYQSDIPGVGLIEVPEAFETNFASIPRIFRWLFTGFGFDRWGSVVHDFVYATGMFPRSVCDAIFREANALAEQLYCGCDSDKWWKRQWNKAAGKTKRGLMYAAVRVGGWSAYTKPENVSMSR